MGLDHLYDLLVMNVALLARLALIVLPLSLLTNAGTSSTLSDPTPRHLEYEPNIPDWKTLRGMCAAGVNSVATSCLHAQTLKV